MAAPKLRTGMDPVENERVSDETGLKCLDKSLTVQSEKEQADINEIVRRALYSGEAPQVVRMPLVGDFAEVGDFRECLHAVREAEASFMALDPRVRMRFGNDAAAFVDFCIDPANLEECRKLGLAVPAPVVPAPAAPAPPPPA